MKCLACDAEIAGPAADFCPSCRAQLALGAARLPDAHIGAADVRDHRTPPLASGTVIANRYRIVRRLGSGGMGTVYQADDLTLHTPVALKFLNAAATGNLRRLELFLNEIRTARQITHPNVCRMFDIGEIDGQLFLSMEHVEGEDLASLLRRIGRLSEDKAVSIGLEICRGLDAAHARGILHRDLKPSNLMIDASGHAKVMDFGLAYFVRGADGVVEIAGTPAYMAPEQHLGEASVQSDIYALGLVLYELFTGRKADTDPRSDDPAGSSPPPTLALDDLSPIIERVINHCLERDPRLRPSSAGAVAAALAKLLQPPWHPAAGLGIPHRKHWMLQRKLGEGGFGETWLAEHANTHERRVFKFCSDVKKLKAFQREITLFRFMRETLGDRDDIAAVLDWQLDEPPYFIESEFGLAVNLAEWLRTEGGADAVPLDDRIDVIRRTAVALTAAHSVGVLHKDVKPANVLVGREAAGSMRVRLCDFGISVATDAARLRDAGVTATAMTQAHGELRSPDSGTRLYMAPELIEGKPATTSADVYALGVMLYQIVIGDLTKALAPGWDRDVVDDVLREDIAAAAEGVTDRRISAAQMAERLASLPDRRAMRRNDEESRQRANMLQHAARRRRNWATAVLAALLFLGLGLGVAFERAESSARQALIDQTLRSNAAMTRLAAAAVSDKLQDAVRLVREQASNPKLRDLLTRTADANDSSTRASLRVALQQHLDQVLAGAERPWFHSWAVADRQASVWARAPYDSIVVGRNYKYREWFNGRQELLADSGKETSPRSEIGFSQAFVSTAQDHALLIGLASPVIDSRAPLTGTDRIIGVLNAGIRLDTFNGWLQIAESQPGGGQCRDRFILLMHRQQLIRHPCPASNAMPLPVSGFSDLAAVRELLNAPAQRTANFVDPLRATGEHGTTRANPAPGPTALAVASSPPTMPEWTLILEQDVDAALRPITSLTADFQGPAHVAFAFGGVAFVSLVVLLWWGGQLRLGTWNIGPR